MWKTDFRSPWLLLILLLLTRSAGAAVCADIWPAAATANSTVAPALPAFTGTTALSLPQTLAAGDHHRAGANLSSGTLTTNAATTRLFINGNLTLSGTARLNGDTNPANLILIVNGSLTMTGSAQIYGLVYATGNISLSNTARITGAATAANNISQSGSASISYDTSAANNAVGGSLCTRYPAPQLSGAHPICNVTNKILVSFSRDGERQPLGINATNLANYSVVSETGTVHTVSAARLSDDEFDVQLTLTPSLSNGRDYIVSVANVRDTSGTAMANASDSFYYSAISNGSIGNYWSGTTFSGNPSLQRVDSTINFNWNSATWPAGSRFNGMSARWEGYLDITTPGTYRFLLQSQDGSRLWLDNVAGTPIIDRWSPSAGGATSAGISLAAGRYPLRADLFKTAANQPKSMRLQWATPSNASFVAVPNANLYTCVNSFASDTGLVAHYQLEGPAWTGAAGEVKDYSGNNLHGATVRTGAANPVSAPARVCNGIFTNGTNFVRIPDSPLMDLTDAMSITAWVRLTSLSTELRSIFSKDENYEFHIDNSRRVYWWWRNTAGTARNFRSPINSIALNTWYHIGVVYSPTRQSIYINGVERAYQTYANEILMTNNDPMEIGADQGLNDRIWNGAIDEVKLYDRPLSRAEVVADMNATHPCLEDLSGFEVSVAPTASVCAPVAVTIRALRGDGFSTLTSYTGTINISTSSHHGNWSLNSAHGSLNPASDNDDNGAVQYQFVAADNGRVVLSLANTHADQLRITATENGGTDTGVSGTVQFSENAFVISTANPDVIAGRNHQIQVEAMRQDHATGDCGRFTAYHGNFPLKAWINRSTGDAAGIAPAISTTGAPVALPDAAPTSNNISLAFNQGVATPQWITTDVGHHSLSLLDDSSGLAVDVDGNPLDITGTGDEFTVRPFGFHTRAQNRRTPVGNNPAASSANGPAFVKAGEDFDVRVTAVQYQSADDTNGDGIPDAGADLSDNAATPAFGQEGGIFRESVTLDSTPVLPVAPGSAHPPLTGVTQISNFSGGSGSATLSWGEVGIITIDAALTDGSYIDSSNVTGTIPRVGRFYPDRFQITDNAPGLRDGSGSWSCDFTYQGQPFGFTAEPQLSITAVNTSGAPTLNYTGDFWKLATPWHSIELDTASPPAASACLSGSTISAGCFSENSASVTRTLTGTDTYDGTAIYSTGAHQLQVNKLNPRPDMGDIPWSPLVDYLVPTAQLTDSDGVCFQNGGPCTEYRVNNIGGTQLRYGRGWIDNTSGPVMTPLIMQLRLQYWDAAGNFIYNNADNAACTGTAILSSDLQLSGYSGNLQAGETAVTSLSPQTGYYLMSLSAPGQDASGQPNAGSALVTWLLDNNPADNNPGEACTGHWLCYDYDGDGLNENPAGRAIFGAVPDQRPILFLRETWR